MELATKQDLEDFKKEILQAINVLSKQDKQQNKSTKYLKSCEVKKEFLLSSTKLYELRRKGEIPFIKVGGIYLYNQQELINHFNSNKHE